MIDFLSKYIQLITHNHIEGLSFESEVGHIGRERVDYINRGSVYIKQCVAARCENAIRKSTYQNYSSNMFCTGMFYLLEL